MWTEGETLRFADIGSMSGRKALQAQLEHQGVSWLDIVRDFRNHYYLKGGDAEPASYDLFIVNGKVGEIEGINERVLHDNEEIEHRKHEREELRPIDDFKLSDHVNELPNIESNVLKAFDSFLESLKNTHVRLSFEELTNTSGPFLPEINQIFKLGRTSKKRIHKGKLLEAYRKAGKFLSLRGKDVMPTYQGIWYEEERYHYMVGSTQPFDGTQSKAHLVRRFALRKGKDLDVAPLLGSMSATFVRHGQYTVLPYPFHLIDLWADINFA